MKNRVYYGLTESQITLLCASFFTLEPKKVIQDTLIDFGIFVEKDFDPQAMIKAFNCLIKRNDALRLRFCLRMNGLRQYIGDYEPYSPETIRIQSRDDFDELIYTPAEPVFLFSKILFRAKIVLCDDGSNGGGIYILCHHLCCDGYSIRIIRKQLESYYLSYCKGIEPPAEREYSITDFFKYDKKYVGSKKCKNDKKWWRQAYNNQPNYSFPSGRIPWKCSLGMVEAEENGEIYTALKKLCADVPGCSYQSIAMTVCALTVYCLGGDVNFCLYMLTHGRMTAALKNTIGCMLNSVPVFYNIEQDAPAIEYLLKANVGYLQALSHSRYPSHKQILLAAKETYIKRFGYNHMWFLFSSQDYSDHGKSTMDLVVPGEDYTIGTFYCALNQDEAMHKTEVKLNYQDRLYTEEEAQRMMKAFVTIIKTAAEQPQMRIRELKNTVNQQLSKQ